MLGHRHRHQHRWPDRATAEDEVTNLIGNIAAPNLWARFDWLLEDLVGAELPDDAGVGHSQTSRVRLLRRPLHADRRIRETADDREDGKTMHQGHGCSIGLVRIGGDIVITVHVGDCRVLRFRDPAHSKNSLLNQPQLVPLTDDQTLARQWGSLAAGPHREVVLHALGAANEACSVEVGYHARSPGDLFLICSKRVTATLDVNAMTKLITETWPRDPAVLARLLVDEACRLAPPYGLGGQFGVVVVCA